MKGMKFLKPWKDLSVATKLYLVVGIMGLLIALELLTLRFAMTQLSAVRAFVGGEGLWSKAQKTSVIALRRYTDTHDEADYRSFLQALEVPLGDRQARLEMSKEKMDKEVIQEGFERGRIHPDDIPPVVELVRRFYWVPHLAEALEIWAEGDRLINVLVSDADKLKQLVESKRPQAEIEKHMRTIEALNDEFTVIEDKFSYVLGEGSRWLENVLMMALLLLVMTVEGTGLFLTISFSRNLSKSLQELNDATQRVRAGDFKQMVPVRSGDELGQLATAINQMTVELEKNIGDKISAEQANQTKSAFLANMSHEIRTPLNAILGFATVLKDDGLHATERMQYLEIIERNGKALTKVIDDILDLSKVEAGGLTVEYLDFSLPSLLQDLVDLFKPAALNKNIELNLSIAPSARRAICSDPTRVRQILTNLVGNAIKFTSEGGVTVHAEVVHDPKDIEVVRFVVRDTGLGLSRSQATRLFEPFTQADNSMTRKYGGTGLGLVLSRKLAQALGGNVYIKETEVGQGSTFIAEFENHQNSFSSTNTRPMAKRPRYEDLRGMKILVVEDSIDNQQLIRVMLGRQGVVADFASDGAEGIELAKNNSYDLVLMDIQMPKMDGFQAVTKLREERYQQPVVALTAHAMKEERDRCLDAGFNDHVSKPIDEIILLNTLSRYAPSQASDELIKRLNS